MREIEARFPHLVRARQTVARGSAPRPRRNSPKSCMRVPMLSLDNAFSDEDVADFVGAGAALSRAEGGRRSPSPPNPRSTGCRPRCAMKTACWCRAPPAATASKARTSPPICARARCAAAAARQAARHARSARRSLYDPCRFRGAEQAPGKGRQARLRQSAQCRGGLGAPARSRRSPRRGRCNFFAYAWGEIERAARQDAMGHAARRSSAGASASIR